MSLGDTALIGHGLFYALAADSAGQPALQRHAKPIARTVVIAGSIIAAVSLIFFRDQWGTLWWIAAAILLMRSRNQLLLFGGLESVLTPADFGG